MVLDILFGIAIILTLTLGYTTYNQFKKVERLEDWVENYSARIIQTKNLMVLMEIFILKMMMRLVVCSKEYNQQLMI